MIEITDEQFEDLIGQSLDELPQDYVQRLLKDVAVTWSDIPTVEQRVALKLRDDQSLFGLYEGVPLTGRMGMTKLMPDKITIFKQPISNYAHDMTSLKDQVKKTVWHEMAHYFGLNHKRIHELE